MDHNPSWKGESKPHCGNIRMNMKACLSQDLLSFGGQRPHAKIGPLIKIATIMAQKSTPCARRANWTRPPTTIHPPPTTPLSRLLLSPPPPPPPCPRPGTHISFRFMAERKANIAIAVQHGNVEKRTNGRKDAGTWWAGWVVAGGGRRAESGQDLVYH